MDALEQCVNDLKVIDAWEKEQTEAVAETANQKRAIRVYEYSKIEKKYASKLAERWGRSDKLIRKLKRQGAKLAVPSNDLLPHGSNPSAGIARQLAHQGIALTSDNEVSHEIDFQNIEPAERTSKYDAEFENLKSELLLGRDCIEKYAVACGLEKEWSIIWSTLENEYITSKNICGTVS